MGEYLSSREALEKLCHQYPLQPAGAIRNLVATVLAPLVRSAVGSGNREFFYRSGRFTDAPTQWDRIFGNAVTPLEEAAAHANQNGYVLVNGYRVATAKLETTDIGPFSPQPWIYDPATAQWSNGRHTSRSAPVGGDTFSYKLTLEGSFQAHPLIVIRNDSAATKEMKDLASFAGKAIWVLGRPKNRELLIRRWGEALQR